MEIEINEGNKINQNFEKSNEENVNNKYLNKDIQPEIMNYNEVEILETKTKLLRTDDNITTKVYTIQPEIGYNKINQTCQNGNENKSEITDNSKYTSHFKRMRIFGKTILENKYWNIIFIIFTIWALFADDIKMLSTQKDADIGFSISIIILQFLFLFEVILSSICLNDYFLGFFFWLDIISIMSLLLDIHWFYDAIIETNNFGKQQTQSAKIGSRAVRVLRVVRLIRIVRIAKIFKNTEKLQEVTEKKEMIQEITKEMNNRNEDLTEKLNVGKKLSDSTMRRVIVLVLAMIIGIIVFNPSFYYEEITSQEYGLKMFETFNSTEEKGFKEFFSIYIFTHENSTNPILYLQVMDVTYGDFNMTLSFRDDEKIEVTENCLNFKFDLKYELMHLPVNYRCFAVFDNRVESTLTAILNISKTILVTIILILGVFCFKKDTDIFVLKPLDSMVKKIQRISKNPFKAKEENEIEDYFNVLKEVEKKSKIRCCTSDIDNDTNVETILLDKSIKKIGTLLALGYGEAGSNLIEKNMNENKGEINPFSEGKRMIGIFSHFNLKNYKQLIKILGQNYSVLVNRILGIVNEVCLEYNLYTVKNVGDSFLLVWKIKEEFMNVNLDNGMIEIQNCEEINQIADLSLICVIKILLRIQTDGKLQEFRTNQDLNEKIQNFHLNLCFGLNLGWAVEGIVGSPFKINISYFSQDISVSKKMFTYSHKFGMNILISEKFVDYLTDDAKKYLKKVEYFDKKITGIYHTLDFDFSSLEINLQQNDSDIGLIKKERFKSKNNLIQYENRELKKKLYEVKIQKGTCWQQFINEDYQFNHAIRYNN